MSRREPRAHWLLLCLFMLVLLGELSLNGYVRHVGGEGVGPAPAHTGGVAPGAVTGGRAVQRVAADGTVTTSAIPARTIALTFDDGPDPEWTPQILDVLGRYGAHATFFEIGSRVNEHPDISRRILAQGHELGVHTFTHINLSAAPAWQRSIELTLTSNAIAAATGRVPALLRPPYSAEPDAVTGGGYAAMRQAGQAGYLVVLTDLDTEDWRRPGVPAIVKLGTPAGGAGAVVMMHDSGGDRSQTVAALKVLLPRLAAQGYRFTTVSAALGLPPAPVAPVGQRLRGHALRWAQLLGGWLAQLLTWLMLIAVGLSGLRLLVQVVCAQAHARRVRRQAREPLRYLGPVSVIVPAFNESANIAATVRSLVACEYPWVEVIVVDDGSTDGTAEIVARLRLPGVHVIRQENAGKPAALNTGIRYARGDILVLVDGDTVFERDALAELVQPLLDPAVGAVSGNTKVANRGGLLGRWQHLEYVMGLNLDRRMFDLARAMPTVPGAIGAFRRAALVMAGGVSRETLAEDTDLTMAICRRGWTVTYEEYAIAWTEAPASLRQLWRQRYRWCYGTMQSMWKHRRAVIERGASGRFGRRCLIYLVLFHVLLPLFAPIVDVAVIYSLLFGSPVRAVEFWLGFACLQTLICAYVLRLDRERLTTLWALPLQQVVYRQLLYLVTVQSLITALLGSHQRWQPIRRAGVFADAGPADDELEVQYQP